MSSDEGQKLDSNADVTANRDETLRELKALFASQLRDSNDLKRPEGIATGLESLDRFLLWGGLPKGALSLLSGSLGMGATSLWIDAAAKLTAQGRWAAWINRTVPLCPIPLYQRSINLDRIVSLDLPNHEQGTQSEKLFWVLQELMSSSLFDLIGCDLGEQRLKEHQLRKLQAQARDSHVALVLLSQRQPMLPKQKLSRPVSSRKYRSSVFALILEFEAKRILVERALHRPVPHSIPRSLSYARFTLHTPDCNSSRSTDRQSLSRGTADSLLETSRTTRSRL